MKNITAGSCMRRWLSPGIWQTTTDETHLAPVSSSYYQTNSTRLWFNHCYYNRHSKFHTKIQTIIATLDNGFTKRSAQNQPKSRQFSRWHLRKFFVAHWQESFQASCSRDFHRAEAFVLQIPPHCLTDSQSAEAQHSTMLVYVHKIYSKLHVQ